MFIGHAIFVEESKHCWDSVLKNMQLQTSEWHGVVADRGSGVRKFDSM